MADLATPFSETMAVLCADLMQRWDEGDQVQVEHYLHRFPQLDVMAHELLIIDLTSDETRKHLCGISSEVVVQCSPR